MSMMLMKVVAEWDRDIANKECDRAIKELREVFENLKYLQSENSCLLRVIVEACMKKYDEALLKFQEADANFKRASKQLEELNYQIDNAKPICCIALQCETISSSESQIETLLVKAPCTTKLSFEASYDNDLYN